MYEVDDDVLTRLDELEHYPDWYTRREEQILVHGISEGPPTELKCHVYLLPGFKQELLELEMLECFTECHGKEYSIAYEHEVGLDYIVKAVSQS